MEYVTMKNNKMHMTEEGLIEYVKNLTAVCGILRNRVDVLEEDMAKLKGKKQKDKKEMFEKGVPKVIPMFPKSIY